MGPMSVGATRKQFDLVEGLPSYKQKITFQYMVLWY